MTTLPSAVALGVTVSPPRSPPKAPLAFRVGIVGHRPNRLGQADLPLLAQRLREILAAVRSAVCTFQQAKPQLYAQAEPMLRAVTPLAEGVDRIFAEQALALGYALCCPLPFAQEVYERDFVPPKALEPNSLDRFRDLLTQARAGAGLVLFEMDGDRSLSGVPYGAAGQVVLNQSDLLVAVWDGGEPAGSGGTVGTLRDAIRDRIPVLLVDACAPHGWVLVRRQSELAQAEVCSEASREAAGTPPNWEGLSALVSEILDLPAEDPKRNAPHGADGGEDCCLAYFRERQPRWNLAVAWRIFRDLLGSHRWRRPPLRVPDFEEASRRDWPDGLDVSGWVNGQLRPHYAWAGKLSGLYADHYRSGYVLAYPLAALAVALVLLPGAVGSYVNVPGLEMACTLAELAVVSAILLLIFGARRGRWHQRWVDYRFLAETIRQLRFLIPLGGSWPFPRLPAQWETYGNPSRSWMAWQMRAVARATGLPDARLDDAYLRQCLAYVTQVLAGQREFHADNSLRSERIDHGLHLAALWVLGATVVCILAHLLPFLHALGPVLILCCAAFPALGAALHGIKNQGEFARVARRSEAMEAQLEALLAACAHYEAEPSLRSADLIRLAQDAADLMLDEVLDWRVIFLDRPPVLPA